MCRIGALQCWNCSSALDSISATLVRMLAGMEGWSAGRPMVRKFSGSRVVLVDMVGVKGEEAGGERRMDRTEEVRTQKAGERWRRWSENAR